PRCQYLRSAKGFHLTRCIVGHVGGCIVPVDALDHAPAIIGFILYEPAVGTTKLFEPTVLTINIRRPDSLAVNLADLPRSIAQGLKGSSIGRQDFLEHSVLALEMKPRAVWRYNFQRATLVVVSHRSACDRR